MPRWVRPTFTPGSPRRITARTPEVPQTATSRSRRTSTATARISAATISPPFPPRSRWNVPTRPGLRLRSFSCTTTGSSRNRPSVPAAPPRLTIAREPRPRCAAASRVDPCCTPFRWRATVRARVADEVRHEDEIGTRRRSDAACGVRLCTGRPLGLSAQGPTRRARIARPSTATGRTKRSPSRRGGRSTRPSSVWAGTWACCAQSPPTHRRPSRRRPLDPLPPARCPPR